jgi:two-component system sensor histidine kinase RegB
MPRAPVAVDFASRSLRLETLVRLRWLAVGGQTVAILVVIFALGFPLPVLPCFVLIVISALLNIALGMQFAASVRLGTWPAFGLLAYDALQLAGLLYLTGGLQNPFAVLLLVPVIVSATALGKQPTAILASLVIAIATVLSVVHLPLPWTPGQSLPLPLTYVAGVWVALVSACLFIGVYTYRVAKEARRLATALNATELVIAREQHLSALDGLAAAAAHELGTPLATIALVAKELERELPEGSPYADDIALLKSQSQRCRDILAKLTSMSSQGDAILARQPLSHLIEEVVEPYRTFDVEIVAETGSTEGPMPVGIRNPAIVYGLANLVENAVDFARDQVDVISEWGPRDVAVTIRDDGPGFAPGIIDRIGEPYVTTRGRSDDGGDGVDHEAGGLGLGFFIAKTLLERNGARLRFSNRPSPHTGAEVRIVWPRNVMDAGRDMDDASPETIPAHAAWKEPAKSL